ncbi:MAG: amidohydrolase family protein [Gammaproteobacteria bacterium]
MRIVDGHAHVGSMRFIPEQFVEGVARNLFAAQAGASGRLHPTLAQIRSLLLSQHQDHNADQLVAAMDEAGVAMTVLLLPDFSHALACPASLDSMAEEHSRIRARHPGRFYVFQGIDPRGGKAALDLFQHTITDYDFNGLKLYPPCGYSPSDERLYPFYEFCRERSLPVLLHTGPTSPVLDFTWSHPSRVDQAARDFPEVPFILAHGVVHHREDALDLCAYRPNVYLDISAFPGILHPLGWRPVLHDLFRVGINHKIIFGTDWPLFSMTSGTKTCVDQLLGEGGPLQGVGARDIELIMSGNIERLIPKAAQSRAAPEPVARLTAIA